MAKAKKPAAPGTSLEESMREEIARRAGQTGDETPPAEDEIPPEETPPEDEEPSPEELEAGGPDEEEETEEEEEEERPRGEPPAKGRKARRIDSLRQRAQAAEREAADLRAREAERERQRQEREAADAQRRAEDEQRRMEAEIAALPPEEQGPARQKRFNQLVANQLQQTQRLNQDLLDSQSYTRACRTDPVLAEISDDVEAMAEQYRNRGMVVNRVTIANYILGERYRKMRASKKPARTPARKQPASRGDAGSGDQARRRESSADDRRARIERLRGKSI